MISSSIIVSEWLLAQMAKIGANAKWSGDSTRACIVKRSALVSAGYSGLANAKEVPRTEALLS